MGKQTCLESIRDSVANSEDAFVKRLNCARNFADSQAREIETEREREPWVMASQWAILACR